MIGIYKITSPSNKVYVGQSTNIEKRWSGYSTNKKKMKEQTKLFNSFRKYGVDNHKFEIIEECNKDKLNDKEVYWIEFYNSVNAGLNVSKGGHYFWEVNKGKKQYFGTYFMQRFHDFMESFHFTQRRGEVDHSKNIDGITLGPNHNRPAK